MRDGVTFYRSFHEAIQEEEDPIKRLQAYEAIFNYALYDQEPDELKGIGKAAFIVAKPVIDKSNESSDNGRKGGAPKGNQNAKKNNQNNPKQPPLFDENNPGCENKTNNDNDNVNVNDNDNEKIKEKKITHGQHKKVKLTETENNRLIEKYGQEMRDKAVDLLDDYLEQHPRKKYSSHKKAIETWVVDAVREREIKKRELEQREARLNQPANRSSPAYNKIHNMPERKYDYAALAKELNI